MTMNSAAHMLAALTLIISYADACNLVGSGFDTYLCEDEKCSHEGD